MISHMCQFISDPDFSGERTGPPEVVQKVPADFKNRHKYPKSYLQNSGTFRCFLGEQPENTENVMKSSENICEPLRSSINIIITF